MQQVNIFHCTGPSTKEHRGVEKGGEREDREGMVERKRKTPTQLRRERKKRQKERERKQRELEKAVSEESDGVVNSPLSPPMPQPDAKVTPTPQLDTKVISSLEFVHVATKEDPTGPDPHLEDSTLDSAPQKDDSSPLEKISAPSPKVSAELTLSLASPPPQPASQSVETLAVLASQVIQCGHGH